MTFSKNDRLEAVPIYRLVCNATGLTVGIEYHWNNGETSALWRGKVHEDVLRVPGLVLEPLEGHHQPRDGPKDHTVFW